MDTVTSQADEKICCHVFLMRLFFWQCNDIIQRMLTKLVGPFDTLHDRPISREKYHCRIYDDVRRSLNWNKQIDYNIIGNIVIQATRR